MHSPTSKSLWRCLELSVFLTTIYQFINFLPNFKSEIWVLQAIKYGKLRKHSFPVRICLSRFAGDMFAAMGVREMSCTPWGIVSQRQSSRSFAIAFTSTEVAAHDLLPRCERDHRRIGPEEHDYKDFRGGCQILYFVLPSTVKNVGEMYKNVLVIPKLQWLKNK